MKRNSNGDGEKPSNDPGAALTTRVQVEAEEVDTEGHDTGLRQRSRTTICYQCRACRRQCTLASGTLFEASKLPLTIWFLALHLLTSGETKLSALALKRQLGVCYDTAWKLKHKLMQAMTCPSGRRLPRR